MNRKKNAAHEFFISEDIDPQYPLNKSLDWPQSLSRCFQEERSLLPVAGVEPRYLRFQTVPSHCID